MRRGRDRSALTLSRSKPQDVSACFAVAIRTAVIDKAGPLVEYGSGGGITWDSSPEVGVGGSTDQNQGSGRRGTVGRSRPWPDRDDGLRPGRQRRHRTQSLGSPRPPGRFRRGLLRFPRPVEAEELVAKAISGPELAGAAAPRLGPDGTIDVSKFDPRERTTARLGCTGSAWTESQLRRRMPPCSTKRPIAAVTRNGRSGIPNADDVVTGERTEAN